MLFANELNRLKAMGVKTLWFYARNPDCKKNMKGSLGKLLRLLGLYFH